MGAAQLASVAVDPTPPPVLISATLGRDCPATSRKSPETASRFPLGASDIASTDSPVVGGLLIGMLNVVSTAPVVAFSRASSPSAVLSALVKLPPMYSAFPFSAIAR